MSLEQTIANLTSQAGLLLDLPQAIATQATAQIASLNATYTGMLAAGNTTLHVHPVTGGDTNAGTLAAPLKTIQKALDVAPPGGIVFVKLMSDYEMTADVYVRNRTLILRSDTSARRRVTFARDVYNAGGVDYRRAKKFQLMHGAALYFEGLTVVVPTADGSYAIMNGTTYHSSIIATPWAPELGASEIGFSYCDIEIPAAPFAGMVGFGGEGTVFGLRLFASTVTGLALNGRLLLGYTNTAGTATSGLPWLATNLATI